MIGLGSDKKNQMMVLFPKNLINTDAFSACLSFQPVGSSFRRVPSNPPLWDLTTLYLFLVLVVFILCRYNIIGSPSKSSLTSPPCLPHGSPKNRERLLQAHVCRMRIAINMYIININDVWDEQKLNPNQHDSGLNLLVYRPLIQHAFLPVHPQHRSLQ